MAYATEPKVDDKNLSSDPESSSDESARIHKKVIERRAKQKAQPWKKAYRPLDSDKPKSASLHDKPWYFEDEQYEAGYKTGGGN